MNRAASTTAAADCRLGADRVTRSFGPVRANSEVRLRVRPHSVHAIVGENGAGKSTLIRLLAGLDQPDSGSVLVDGRPVRLRNPAAGLRRGIGLVQQELALIGSLTLLENLILGAEPRRGLLVDRARARARAEELAAGVGVQVDWDRPAAEAPVSVQQQVEILRLLHRGADVLILDEPTAVLAPAQVVELLRLLRELRSTGKTIVFISHKLDEVLAVADDITILRGGRSVHAGKASALDPDQLATLIVGEQMTATHYRPGGPTGPPMLEVTGLTADDSRGVRRLDDVSFTVRGGEIVGVAGVAGNGQDELVETVVGLRRARGGRIRISQTDVSAADVTGRRVAGLAYVSADRKHEGLALDATLEENAVIGFHRGALSRRGHLSPRRTAEFAKRLLDTYRVRYGSARSTARTLSGGNQQRLVVGRELAHDPAVLLASQPTRGVDLKGIAHIRDQLRDLAGRGAGVLLVSEELDELLAISDRVVVLHRGRIAGELPGGCSRQELGALMLGGREAAA